MKKISYVFAIIALIWSCEREEVPTFEVDQLISRLIENLNEFQAANPNELNRISDILNNANTIVNEINFKYGGTDQVDVILDDLINKEVNSNVRYSAYFGEHDEDPCTRNEDGTTYWGQCSFWQKVRAYIGSLGCAGTTEEIYNCVQGSICKSCGDRE